MSIARLRLARTDSIGPITYRRLLARYGTAEAALAALPGIARKAGRTTPMRLPSAASAQKLIEQTQQLDAKLVFLGDPTYPALLARLPDAPPVITVAGTIPDQPAVAIVGSRNASANGRKISETIAEDLANAGYSVVSGLARGIDTAAHRGALRSGRTIACIAGGLDHPYPPENKDLQTLIAESGAVIAEMPLGTEPQARHFPRRNRIIAGLTLGTLVVEAAIKSGSLITARLAAEAGREVFAVPGSPLDARCRGSNGLLRDGAHLTETATDIIVQLQGRIAHDVPGLAESLIIFDDADPEEADKARVQVLDLLSPAPTAVDDLIRRCQFSAAAVMSVLLDLEIAGRIEALPGNRVALLEPGS